MGVSRFWVSAVTKVIAGREVVDKEAGLSDRKAERLE